MRRIALVISLCSTFMLCVAAQASADGVTNAGDDGRTGWYPNESKLTPALVQGGTFGQEWSASVDGQVYAQPLLEGGTLLVATETNHVYGLDPATGTAKWSTSLDTPWNPADIGCGDLTPSIGVTSTPVIDTATNTAYLTHKTYVSGTSGPAAWYLDALDMTSGKERPGFPVRLSGTAQNDPSDTFLATNQLQRPGLLLLNGVVYAAFGSHCDYAPWQGWIFGVSTSGSVTARWVDNPTVTGGGIWQSGAGLTSDGPSTILLSTGNGGAPSTPAAGNNIPANLGESIVRVNVQADGTLQAVDFFAPYNATTLDDYDADFASGGVTSLPDQYFGTSSLPHLAIAVGKEGYVYLLNRDSLGGIAQGPNGGDDVVQRIGPRGGVWSRPAVWPGDGGYIYIPTATGLSGGGSFDVYKYGVSGTGEPALSLVGTSTDAFGWGSGAPVVTSNGTASGSALVWVIWSTNRQGLDGQLRAYLPVPVNGHLVLVYSAPIGTASNYSVPGVGDGQLFVGTRDGKVLAYGSPVTPPLSAQPVTFPATTVGSGSQATLTLTANQTLTLSSLRSDSASFKLGSPSQTLPVTLNAGQTISVPVTFSPTSTGLSSATVTASTDGGTATFELSGTGQSAAPLLSVTPRVIAFGGTTVGGELTGTVTFSNAGASTLTITSVQLPGAPFSATGVPSAGTQIAAGGSITVTVAFDPTALGSFSDAIGLSTDGGSGSVGLAGSAGSPGALQITGEMTDFGSTLIGTSVTRSFELTNTGGTALTITKSKPPSGGEFAAASSLEEGTTIAPGETLTETVTFTPSAAGAASGTWVINGDDTSGLHEVSFSGVGASSAPSSAGALGTPSTLPFGSAAGATGSSTPVALEQLLDVSLRLSALRSSGARTVTVSYHASTAGVTRFTLERILGGRREGTRCEAPSTRNRSGAACTRYVVLARFSHADLAGANSAKLALRALPVGRYVLLARPSDAGGGGSTVSVHLAVVRR